jgi:alpha-ketoglutarate-dependent taurine dioxygenase
MQLYTSNFRQFIQEPNRIMDRVDSDNNLISIDRLASLCQQQRLKQFLDERHFVILRGVSFHSYQELTQLVDIALGTPREIMNRYRKELTNYSDLLCTAHSTRLFCGNSNSYQPFHRDICLSDDIINYISMYCLEPAAKGGDTYLLNSEDVIRYLGISHFRSEVYYTSSIRKKLDLIVGANQLNFNPIFDKVEFKDKSSQEFFDLIAYFTHYQAKAMRIQLDRGDLLIFNNNTLLHARSGFEKNSRRHMMRKQYT